MLLLTLQFCQMVYESCYILSNNNLLWHEFQSLNTFLLRKALAFISLQFANFTSALNQVFLDLKCHTLF